MAKSTNDLQAVKNAYEQLGRQDPLYAVLSKAGHKGNRWDTEEFLQVGEESVREIFAYLGDLDVQVAKDRALDFGCGAGRLTQALADRFDEVLGVDISSTMLDAARKINTKGDRIRFLLNVTDALEGVESGSVDFVLTTLTLQHIPAFHQANYIREFMRALRPGGVAVFHIVNARRFGPDSIRGRLIGFRRRARRVWRKVAGRAAVEIHHIQRTVVDGVIAEAGCEIRDVLDAGPEDKPGHELRYCVVKPG